MALSLDLHAAVRWPAGVPDELDLRRRHAITDADRLLARAEHLDPRERLIVQAVLRDGQSAREVAAALGVDRKVVGRRFHAAAERLRHPVFAFVLLHRDTWPAQRRNVATAFFIHGRSMRDIAAALRLSVYAVRKHHDATLALLDAAAHAQTGAH